jgi:hypothetical protein
MVTDNPLGTQASEHAWKVKIPRKTQRCDCASLPSLFENSYETPMPFSVSNLDLCWTLCRLCPTKLLEVEFEEPTPSWKAFNTRIVSFWCSKTTVGYLPLLPYSLTSCEVVASAISICQKTAAKL